MAHIFRPDGSLSPWTTDVRLIGGWPWGSDPESVASIPIQLSPARRVDGEQLRLEVEG